MVPKFSVSQSLIRFLGWLRNCNSPIQGRLLLNILGKLTPLNWGSEMSLSFQQKVLKSAEGKFLQQIQHLWSKLMCDSHTAVQVQFSSGMAFPSPLQ